MPNYIRYRSAPLRLDNQDDIVVSDHTPMSRYWEFRIVSARIGATIDNIPEFAIKVVIFEDAVKCLWDPNVVSAIRRLEGKRTLDEAELVLQAHNIMPRGSGHTEDLRSEDPSEYQPGE